MCQAVLSGWFRVLGNRWDWWNNQGQSNKKVVLWFCRFCGRDARRQQPHSTLPRLPFLNLQARWVLNTIQVNKHDPCKLAYSLFLRPLLVPGTSSKQEIGPFGTMMVGIDVESKKRKNAIKTSTTLSRPAAGFGRRKTETVRQ